MYQSSISITIQGDTPASLHFPVREDVASQLYLRALEAKSALGERRLGELIAYSLLGSLLAIDESESTPPTVPQIKFALDIARELGVELPVGALQSRIVIGCFIM